ncbi:MAG: cell wall hydrolase [Sphingomonas sp.]|nr:cell wall hydrolase [Sphingomonas sp.]
MLRLPRIALIRDTVGTGLVAAILFGGVFGAGQGIQNGGVAPHIAPPTAPSMAVRPLAPQQAVVVNQEIPIAIGLNPAASAFVFTGNAAARAQALECLSSAVYYEAGSQSVDGERAVAQVILNRVRHPAFPASVCGVVYQGSTRVTGCQFTFTCDGSLNRRPDAAGWRRANAVAEASLAGQVFAPVGWATHYHADYVVPYWAATLAKNAVVGAHLFYHWSGNWGLPGAFAQRPSGHEASAASLRSAALAVEAATAGLSASSSAEAAIAQVPGVEAIKLAPSMRGDKRVALRFNQTARNAADDATHKDYSESVKASETLRWSLSGESASEAEKPLGKAAPAAVSGTAGSSLQPGRPLWVGTNSNSTCTLIRCSLLSVAI